jgi:hypothetical protein
MHISQVPVPASEGSDIPVASARLNSTTIRPDKSMISDRAASRADTRASRRSMDVATTCSARETRRSKETACVYKQTDAECEKNVIIVECQGDI